MVVNGQEMEPYEVRAYKSNALAIAVTDGTVAHGVPTIDGILGITKDSKDRQELAQELYGSREAAVPISYEKKALTVWDKENNNTVGDMLGTCRWAIKVGLTKMDLPPRLFSLATGQDTSEDDLLRAAQRTLTLERAFRIMRGVRRDTLPKRVFESAVPDGPCKGERLDREKFERMLDEYYSLRGWDKDGIPKETTFKEFGLFSEWKTFDRQLRKEG